MRASLTPAGWGAVGFTAALLLFGLATARPMLTGLGGVLGLWLVAAALLGRWNLKNLRVRRQMPDAVFAGRACAGSLVLDGQSEELQLAELDGTAEATVARVDGEVNAAVHWCFPSRGLHHLSGVRVSSTYPFGWVAWSMIKVERFEIVVWPTPGRATDGAPARDRQASHDRGAGQRPDLAEDFAGLRTYRAGDPPRAIHWPSSARSGAPMVVVRHGAASAPRWLKLKLEPGRSGERQLSDATADVLRAADLGEPVGLILGSEILHPATGRAASRRMLDALARATVAT
jgi:uncharacterized protein (DUF58 family)